MVEAIEVQKGWNEVQIYTEAKSSVIVSPFGGVGEDAAWRLQCWHWHWNRIIDERLS